MNARSKLWLSSFRKSVSSVPTWVVLRWNVMNTFWKSSLVEISEIKERSAYTKISVTRCWGRGSGKVGCVDRVMSGMVDGPEAD